MSDIKLAYPQLFEDAERWEIERRKSFGCVRIKVKERKPDGELVFEPVLPRFVVVR